MLYVVMFGYYKRPQHCYAGGNELFKSGFNKEPRFLKCK